MPEDRTQIWIAADRFDQAGGNAREQLKRPLSALVESLPAQHPGPLPCTALGQLGEQARLAAAGFGLKKHEPAVTVAGLAQERVENGQLIAAADKRRLGQRAAAIAQTHDQRGFRHAAFQRLADRRQIGQHRLG